MEYTFFVPCGGLLRQFCFVSVCAWIFKEKSSVGAYTIYVEVFVEGSSVDF